MNNVLVLATNLRRMLLQVDSSNLAADAPATKSKPQMPVPAASPENEKEDYTSRLLKAKKKVWDDPSGGKKS